MNLLPPSSPPCSELDSTAVLVGACMGAGVIIVTACAVRQLLKAVNKPTVKVAAWPRHSEQPTESESGGKVRDCGDDLLLGGDDGFGGKGGDRLSENWAPPAPPLRGLNPELAAAFGGSEAFDQLGGGASPNRSVLACSRQPAAMQSVDATRASVPPNGRPEAETEGVPQPSSSPSPPVPGKARLQPLHDARAPQSNPPIAQQAPLPTIQPSASRPIYY